MENILTVVAAVFAVIGAIDKITGNHLKLGDEFERGILTLGPLSLSMIGMMTVSPLLSKVLLPIVSPVAEFLGFDASALAGLIIANDMGGASLAEEIATDSLLGAFHGLCVASMLGATISFTVPYALKSVKQELLPDIIKGLLCGICTVPIGCFVSGLIMKINIFKLLLNLIPLIVISGVISFGLIKSPKICIKVFTVFGKLLIVLITCGLAVGIFGYLTKIQISQYLAPIDESFKTVFNICLVLSGMFPLIAVISKILKKPILVFGKKLGINEISVTGLISTLANNIATIDNADKMDKKGRILNFAFAVSASFVLGDHLAFTLSFNSDYTLAVIIGKLTAGISALIVASLITKTTDSAKEDLTNHDHQ